MPFYEEPPQTNGSVSDSIARSKKSFMIRALTEVASVIAAVAEGDLSQRIPVAVEGRAVKGELLAVQRLTSADLQPTYLRPRIPVTSPA
jgi:hypothetical protein